MHQEPSNTTLNFIDLSINKSIDFINSSVRQLAQLIFCLVFIMVVGRVINFFMIKTQLAENQPESDDKKIEPEDEPEVCTELPREIIKKEASGWESELIVDSHTPPLELAATQVTAKTIKKQLRRKCMSVGPILLTPTSQIVRTLDAEEREERYRYDIVPLDSTAAKEAAATMADDVCVPCGSLLINERSQASLISYCMRVILPNL